MAEIKPRKDADAAWRDFHIAADALVAAAKRNGIDLALENAALVAETMFADEEYHSAARNAGIAIAKKIRELKT